MVPDRMYVKSALPTGNSRYRIMPRRVFNWLLGPKVVREIEVEITRGWSNPYNHSTTTDTQWRRERRQDQEVVVCV